MASTINTNITSINAQRNLNYTGQSLSTTMARLSSGLRVNSAKDDAAGMAIADRMNTQVRGLQVASRNANDGISLAQTAEGALGRIGDMLQRARELAVQAANTTNSAGDRKSLQAEVAQIIAEVDRVAKQTNFNGQKILDGSFAGAVFQVAANSGDNVTVGSLADTRSSQIGNISYAKTDMSFDVKDTEKNRAIARYDEKIPAGTLKIQVGANDPVELEFLEPANSSVERMGQVITAINNKSADTGVTAYMVMKPGTQEYDIAIMSSKLDKKGDPLSIKFSGFTTSTTGLSFSTMQTDEKVVKTDTAITGGKKADDEINKLVQALATNDPLKLSDVEKVKSAINNVIDIPGFGSYLRLALQDPASEAAKEVQKVVQKVAVGTAKADLDNIKTKVAALATEYNGVVGTEYANYQASTKDQTSHATFKAYADKLAALTGDDTYDFSAVTATATDSTIAEAKVALAKLESKIGFRGLEITSEHRKMDQRGIDDVSVATQEGAWIALKKIDSALDQVNMARGTLGALQTRFENTVNNIDIQVENLAAARGRIIDADFAKETSNLSRTQVLQQAGTTMVAQANQIPQRVLELLRN